jgi:hypothetical protein
MAAPAVRAQGGADAPYPDARPSKGVTVEWMPRPSLNVARGGLTGTTHAVTYAIGGFTSGFGAELDSMEELDPVRGRWRPVAPMPTARGNPAAAAVRRDVYVFGGFVRDKALDVVEVFDPRSGRWRTGRPLPAARGGAAAAAIGGRIYVVGGFDDADRATATVFSYDPRTDTWDTVHPMGTRRGLLKVADLNGHLYAIGGVDDSRTFLSTVERYDAGSDRWQPVAPLLTGRGNPGVAVAGRHVFVIGGAGPAGPLRTTERYDARADRWHELEPLLAVGRASLSAAVTTGGRGNDRGAFLVAFGGFEVDGGPPIASARVEALRVDTAG